MQSAPSVCPSIHPEVVSIPWAGCGSVPNGAASSRPPGNQHLVGRRAQERAGPGPEHVPQDEEQQRPRRPQEEQRLRREESARRKDSEDRGRPEAQDRLGRLFPHQEPGAPAVHAPWSTAGTRGRLLYQSFWKVPSSNEACPGCINRGGPVRLLVWHGAAVHCGALGAVNSPPPANWCPPSHWHLPSCRQQWHAFHWDTRVSRRGPSPQFSLGVCCPGSRQWPLPGQLCVPVTLLSSLLPPS